MFNDSSGDTILYHRIADEIRKNILSGVYQPGDQIPTVRELKQQWNCSQGTVHHAYKELAQQGLVISRKGGGTRVVSQLDYGKLQLSTSLRKARLVHQAETFLLESVMAGYSFEEIKESLDLARMHMQSF